MLASLFNLPAFQKKKSADHGAEKLDVPTERLHQQEHPKTALMVFMQS
jgi:hypothetical protein